ncbi:predicted protein [Sclerotinia sclerotiorum 1980 UF-70]|uniref:Uncharacterized protein n=1 Tax=Sclerotinia sclerotiorum (strain ATCC 18683 / 1980 / Ss-1) TaxID=665079 RepID=A7EBF5_SCLS1|nr:predicted protein [Sclerotinia sclerotiorum 1980 UF-70]EDN99783.1 predicted protein [Sclerotinia sclerotiorum 1980 UF-70]
MSRRDINENNDSTIKQIVVETMMNRKKRIGAKKSGSDYTIAIWEVSVYGLL